MSIDTRRNARIMLLFLIAGIATLSCPTTSPAQRPSNGLTKKQQATLQQVVIPAVNLGDQQTVLTALAALTKRMQAAEIEAADRFLQNQRIDPVGSLLAAARVDLLARGRSAKDLPAPDYREMTLVLPSLTERIESAINRKKTHASCQVPRPSPAGFMEYRGTLESLHKIERQLEQASRWAQYCVELGGQAARFKRLKLNDQQRAMLQRDYRQLHASVTEHLADLRKTQLDLRLERLEDAESVLRLSEDKAERFMAVCALVQDARFLESKLKAEASKNGKSGKNNKKAKGTGKSAAASRNASEQLVAKVAATARRARDLSGKPLLQKATWFIQGLEWWSRGRYGSGPLADGLLKSERAKKDPIQRISLYMPSAASVPTDPETSSGTPFPTYDRRHHYTWNWENRQIYVTEGGGRTNGPTETKTTVTRKRSHTFW